ALQHARLPFLPLPVFNHFRFQVAAYQSQHPPVLYRSGQTRHQESVIHPVEELLQIHIHHPPFATPYVTLCLLHRLLDKPVHHRRD
ncbi:hypothetical protein, partial [Escherichia coli]|uniref:hypothetical protein n=1 Tax=Escherichia coli TaxID=562 RepID=UPI0021C5EC23